MFNVGCSFLVLHTNTRVSICCCGCDAAQDLPGEEALHHLTSDELSELASTIAVQWKIFVMRFCDVGAMRVRVEGYKLDDGGDQIFVDCAELSQRVIAPKPRRERGETSAGADLQSAKRLKASTSGDPFAIGASEALLEARTFRAAPNDDAALQPGPRPAGAESIHGVAHPDSQHRVYCVGRRSAEDAAAAFDDIDPPCFEAVAGSSGGALDDDDPRAAELCQLASEMILDPARFIDRVGFDDSDDGSDFALSDDDAFEDDPEFLDFLYGDGGDEDVPAHARKDMECVDCEIAAIAESIGVVEDGSDAGAAAASSSGGLVPVLHPVPSEPGSASAALGRGAMPHRSRWLHAVDVGCGTIVYYETGRRFRLVALCRLHDRCSRERTATGPDEGTSPGGRPLGFLAAWLSLVAPGMSFAEHTAPALVRGLTQPVRAEARDLLKLTPEGLLLLSVERQQRAGEPEEPVRQP